MRRAGSWEACSPSTAPSCDCKTHLAIGIRLHRRRGKGRSRVGGGSLSEPVAAQCQSLLHDSARKLRIDESIGIHQRHLRIDRHYLLGQRRSLYSPAVIEKSKLREVVSFKSLWGHLSKKNDPTYNPELFRFPEDITVTRMSGRPYMEISAGLDNIFSVLRVDYVWRLSYRNTPGAPNSGLRIAMHFTF